MLGGLWRPAVSEGISKVEYRNSTKLHSGITSFVFKSGRLAHRSLVCGGKFTGKALEAKVLKARKQQEELRKLYEDFKQEKGHEPSQE